MLKRVFASAVTAAVIVVACNGGLQQQCVTGQTVACAGSNGCSGNQTCQGDGTYGPCTCAGMDDSGADAGNDVQVTNDSATNDSPIDVGVDSPGSPCTGAPPSPDAGTGDYVSNPTPTTVTQTKGYTLHMELNGYNNYGASDGKADILYTSTINAWTFSVPSSMPVKSATIAVSLVADDSTTLPASDFTYQLWSGNCSFDTPTALAHGTPFGGMFTNWVEVDEPAYPQAGGTYTVTIFNTSNATTTDWIGVDWIELRVLTQ
jgi:hypothetical protein